MNGVVSAVAVVGMAFLGGYAVDPNLGYALGCSVLTVYSFLVFPWIVKRRGL